MTMSTGTSLMPTINTAKIAPPARGSATQNVRATAEVAPAGDGAFRTSCTVAQMSFNDPIVFPGQVGKSHLHTFFGNTGVNANSTPDSIRNTGNSTCRGGIANRSAYWVPTLIDTQDGTPIAADSIEVYYKSGLFDGALVRPIPAGLRMIAGNPAATAARAESADFSYRFKCIGGPHHENDHYGAAIPNCDVGAEMIQEVFFPQCWDGVNLDSPDHQGHMSYTVNVPIPNDPRGWSRAACPASHPVIIPAITFNVVYRVTKKDAPVHWRLSSDNYDPVMPGGYSSHADWFNGWINDISNAWAANCIKAKKDCHSHLLGDGRTIY